jgi:hypothetical protein
MFMMLPKLHCACYAAHIAESIGPSSLSAAAVLKENAAAGALLLRRGRAAGAGGLQDHQRLQRHSGPSWHQGESFLIYMHVNTAERL